MVVHEKSLEDFWKTFGRFFQNFSMGPVRSVVKVVSPSNFVNTLIRR